MRRVNAGQIGRTNEELCVMISREGIAESRALIADGVEIEVAQERRWSVKQRGRRGNKPTVPNLDGVTGSAPGP